MVATLTAIGVNLSIVIVAMSRDSSWDEYTQRQILGACYYGFALSSPLGGRVAKIMDGKWVVGMDAFLTAHLTLLAPLCATHSTDLFLTVLVLRGATEGVFPRYHFPLGPQSATLRKRHIYFICLRRYSGGGRSELDIVRMALRQPPPRGWPSTFYFFGGFGVLGGALTLGQELLKPRVKEYYTFSESRLDSRFSSDNKAVSSREVVTELESGMPRSLSEAQECICDGSGFGSTRVLLMLPPQQ
ncbi:sialin-like [Penaeus monodon]|uniref:sialin-like n=1 Tax=Penaeus monodon TaxID=6687 RepID=UPI0018A7406E|nr:sialin-like [Penaeus monodon]